MKQHADSTQPSPFLTTADLAIRWKVTSMTLRRWRKAGKLKVSFLGRGVRFAITEVERVERDAQA
ncbi:helix-turn-helix domain-containing protein [Prosthecobacter sp.]|uniref:helix-turn-helix domain-containing protein n=1 Tax=Prosthecobacter sp. TaxID=1965333 RepID=UPI00248851C1|nr:helix-turn-helix domain-containing protein [Prosthecobacter sp.]MDI1313512.1 helix-turn-helix domain-containing protein [Prosthecobacter sp.]